MLQFTQYAPDRCHLQCFLSLSTRSLRLFAITENVYVIKQMSPHSFFELRRWNTKRLFLFTFAIAPTEVLITVLHGRR